MAKRRHPEVPFESIKGTRPGPGDTDRSERGYDKRATTLSVIASAEEKEADTGGLLSTQLFAPNEEQLAKINQFTLRKVSADEVACFTTHSCNDIPDRDDDVFSTKTVKQFSELAPPFSPTGKGFMVSHDTTKLAVGRIFDTGTGSFTYDSKKHTKLTNDVYIPRTVSTNADFIENMEMGVNWAVSVGVMLESATCTVGKSHDWGYWSWWCSEGHDKGMFYDPDSEEEDSWGYPLPVSETAKNATKCVRSFEGAKDMYELSMVYLGAQYMAGLAEKDPAFSGVLKAASAKHIPVIGLRREESEKMPLPRIPEKLREAAKNHKVEEENGTFSWVDDDRLVWSFTPGEDLEPLFLGKRPESGMTQAELNAKVQDLKAKRTEATEKLEAKSTEGAAALASQLDGLLTSIDEALDNCDVDSANPLVDQAQTLMDQLFDELYEEEDPENDDTDPGEWGENEIDDKKPQGEIVSKKAVVAALERFPSLPESFKTAISGLADDSKVAVETLLKTVASEFSSMRERAEAGDAYVKRLRTDVLDWYRKAKTDPRSNSGVDVSKVERLLDRVGDDPETMEALIEDYKAEAQAKFPSGVRRSTVSDDVNAPNGEEVSEKQGDIETRMDGDRVKRIHG